MPTREPLKPAFTTIPLERGVTLHFRPAHGFKTELVRVFFRAPLDGLSAVRQIYAALLSRGTRSIPDRRALSAHLEGLYGAGYGVALQRMYGRHILAFRASTVAGRYLPGCPPNLDSLFDLIRDALDGPPEIAGALVPETFEEERRNLLRDFEARVNSKTRYAAERLREEMYAPHPLGLPETGTRAEIESATSGACASEGERMVREGEADIFVVARSTAAQAEKRARKRLRLAPRDDERFHLSGLTAPRARRKSFAEEMDVQQGKLAIGYRIPAWTFGEARFVAAMADTILGTGPMSKLFRNVRERRSLCYDIHSWFDSVTGTIGIGAGVAPSNRKPALRAIENEVKELAEGRVSEDELSSARRTLLSAIDEVGDTQSALVDFFYARSLLSRPETTLAEVSDGIRSVKPGGVSEFVARARLDTVFFLDARAKGGARDAVS